MMKFIVSFVLFVIASVGNLLWADVVSPELGIEIGVNQVNGGSVEASAMRAYHPDYLWVYWITYGMWFLITLCMFKPELAKIGKAIMKNSGKVLVMLLMAGAMLFGSIGCRPYEDPQYDTVENNETAFVISLEGDASKQAKFDSIEQLESLRVASKRIRITRRWDQQGRIPTDGKWIPTIRVIRVNRTPETREWTPDKNSGTSTADQGIWAESSDSVGFATGISATAMIEEKDTARFLYYYPAKSLAQIMDTEMRTRIQACVASFSARYTMDLLRDKKQEMIDFVRNDVTTYYSDRGITVTTIGQFGGFTYENPAVQEAIDAVFVAQQDKQVEIAKQAAAEKKIERLRLEGEAEAKKLKEIAQGKKEAAILQAQGEAEAIRMVNAAAEEANKNPLFLSLKQLEVQSQQIRQWNGQFPQWFMSSGAGDGMGMLFQTPTPSSHATSYQMSAKDLLK